MSRILLFSMALIIFMLNIEFTGIVIIISPMAHALHISLAKTQWALSSYLLSFVALIVSAGRMGDLWGKRNILLIGLTIFILASLLAGLATNQTMLIIGRFLQGVGCSLAWPNATATAFHCMPKHRQAFAIGIVTGVIGFSMAIGPPLAGVLAHTIGWRWFFLFNAPLSVIPLIVVLKCMPATQRLKQENFDLTGFALLSIGLALLVMCINSIPNLAKTPWYFTSCLIGTITIISVFIFWELKHVNPLIDFSLFKLKRFVLGISYRWMTNLCFYTFLFLMGLYLHNQLNYSILQSGLIFLPMTLLIGILSPMIGHFIDRSGPVRPAILGLIIFSLSYFLFSQISTATPTLNLILLFTLPGLAYGFMSPSLLALSMKALPENHSGLGSGIFYMSSVFGSLVGVVIAGTLLHFYDLAEANKIIMLGFCFMLGGAAIFLVSLVLSKKLAA